MAYCLDAWEHGWQAEHGELCAWAMDATATIALYTNRPEAARRAIAGVVVDGHHLDAGVSLEGIGERVRLGVDGRNDRGG